MLRQFRKSNAFEQRAVFCTGMKTFFSSVITPAPPNNVAKRFVNVYLFPTLKTGKGEAIFPEIIEQNSNQGKRVVILMRVTLTKAVDMGHTWSKYGNGMGQPMTNVWVLYGFYMGC